MTTTVNPVTPPVGWHWRYLPHGGTCLHALHHPGDRMSRCGVKERGRGWRGNANRFERDRAATLPLRSTCLRSIRGGAR